MLEELLAKLIEVVDYGNRAFVAAHGGGDLEPIRIPRPWDSSEHEELEEPEKPALRPATPEEVAQFFQLFNAPSPS